MLALEKSNPSFSESRFSRDLKKLGTAGAVVFGIGAGHSENLPKSIEPLQRGHASGSLLLFRPTASAVTPVQFKFPSEETPNQATTKEDRAFIDANFKKIAIEAHTLLGLTATGSPLKEAVEKDRLTLHLADESEIPDASVMATMEAKQGRINIGRSTLVQLCGTVRRLGIPDDEVLKVLANNLVPILAHEYRHYLNFAKLKEKGCIVEVPSFDDELSSFVDSAKVTSEMKQLKLFTISIEGKKFIVVEKQNAQIERIWNEGGVVAVSNLLATSTYAKTVNFSKASFEEFSTRYKKVYANISKQIAEGTKILERGQISPNIAASVEKMVKECKTSQGAVSRTLASIDSPQKFSIVRSYYQYLNQEPLFDLPN